MKSNMDTLTIDVMKAILALQRTNPPAWQRFQEWINHSFIQLTSRGIAEKDETELRWLQGKSQLMAELVSDFNDIEKLLKQSEVVPQEIKPSLVFD